MGFFDPKWVIFPFFGQKTAKNGPFWQKCQFDRQKPGNHPPVWPKMAPNPGGVPGFLKKRQFCTQIWAWNFQKLPEVYGKRGGVRTRFGQIRGFWSILGLKPRFSTILTQKPHIHCIFAPKYDCFGELLYNAMNLWGLKHGFITPVFSCLLNGNFLIKHVQIPAILHLLFIAYLLLNIRLFRVNCTMQWTKRS